MLKDYADQPISTGDYLLEERGRVFEVIDTVEMAAQQLATVQEVKLRSASRGSGDMGSIPIGARSIARSSSNKRFEGSSVPRAKDTALSPCTPVRVGFVTYVRAYHCFRVTPDEFPVGGLTAQAQALRRLWLQKFTTGPRGRVEREAKARHQLADETLRRAGIRRR